jgi:hypothetical protein
VAANTGRNKESGRIPFSVLLTAVVLLFLGVIIVKPEVAGSIARAAGRALSAVLAGPGEPIVVRTSSVVKERLPASEFVSLIYKYESVGHRPDMSGSWWLKAPDLLVVVEGTIKLGFNLSDIKVREDEEALILDMPPIKILSHEQHTEEDRVQIYEVVGGDSRGVMSPLRRKPQDVIRSLGDVKLEKNKQLLKDEESMELARISARYYLERFLVSIPVVRERYNCETCIIFNWSDAPEPNIEIRETPSAEE